MKSRRPDIQTLNAIYLKVVDILNEAELVSSRIEANWLIEKYLKVNPTDVYVTPERGFSQAELAPLFSACERRISGEPLAYILNEREFYGLKFFVNENVLIPRPETELLVDWAIEWTNKFFNKKRSGENGLQILDIGTGSGCLGLAILNKLCNKSELTMVDISPQALVVAKKNAEDLGLINRTKIVELNASELAQLEQKFDLIVANPPYISVVDQSIEPNVKKHEPSVALFSDEQGLWHLKRWSATLPQILKPGGGVVFEFGSTQGAEVMNIFKKLNFFSKLQIHKDYSGHDRFISGEYEL